MTGSVGIVGVGNMGGGMAGRLLDLGWRVGVRDLDPAKEQFFKGLGAEVRTSASSLAIDFVATIVCVVDAAQTEEVLLGPDGIAATAAPGHTVLLCPTIAPQDTERLARALADRGIHTIDAPMSGGPARARDGSMSLMVACPDALFRQHAELLAALSGKVFHVSQRVGDGARTKLVNNLLAGINLVGAAEVMALAQKMGLDLPTTLGVIEQSSGQSWIGTDRMRRALDGDYAPRAHMTLLAKDTRLAVEAAQAAGFEGPLGASASGVFAQALQAGLAGEDDGALLKLLSGR